MGHRARGCELNSPRLLRPCCDSGVMHVIGPWRRLCLLASPLILDSAERVRRERRPPKRRHREEPPALEELENTIRQLRSSAAVRKERPFPSVWPTGQIDVKRSCKSQFVSRSWKILAVAPSANNRGLIVFEMAESPRRDDPQRNAGSGSYLSIAIRHGTSR